MASPSQVQIQVPQGDIDFAKQMINRDPERFEFPTSAQGPSGVVEYTEADLRNLPSGDIFGGTQNAGMLRSGARARDPNIAILTTLGGWPDHALGAHTGHNELYLLVQEAANELSAQGLLPFALHTSDTCDGRTQGTIWAIISLASRNIMYNSLATQLRGIPNAEGAIGIATCDKGLPAMTMLMMSLMQQPGNLPGVIIPGGVTLPPTVGEDAGKVQTLGVRFAQGLVTLAQAQDLGCKACATPGGGCQFFGTAATAQAVAEGLGLTTPHAALAPSGFPIWLSLGRDAARTVARLRDKKLGMSSILSDDSIENAMLVHAAMGGSTNLLLHLPAYAHTAGLTKIGREDFERINRLAPRIVDCLPTGIHPTIRVFMAGGVPEVMLHLRDLGLLKTDAMTVSGLPVGEVLALFEKSDRRTRLRDRLYEVDHVNPDDVIMPPAVAKERGLTSTVVYPTGNIAPEGSVVKATSINPKSMENGVYKKTGPARVFTSERAAIQAIKGNQINPGDVIVIICRGPLGAGMPETYEITSALKTLPHLQDCALVTDARFSGVTTGPCFGHVSPEALAPNSPLGKLRDGDMIEIIVDPKQLHGSINLVGENGKVENPRKGDRILSRRSPRDDLAPDPNLPTFIKNWGMVQQVSGGVWAGCVEDSNKLAEALGQASFGKIFR